MTKIGFRTSEKRNAGRFYSKAVIGARRVEDSACLVGANLQRLGFLIGPPADGVAAIQPWAVILPLIALLNGAAV
jgi:hypothetical protein